MDNTPEEVIEEEPFVRVREPDLDEVTPEQEVHAMLHRALRRAQRNGVDTPVSDYLNRRRELQEQNPFMKHKHIAELSDQDEEEEGKDQDNDEPFVRVPSWGDED